MAVPSLYTLAYTGRPMRLNGVRAPVVFDLAGMQRPSHQVPVLRGHNHEQIVGHVERLKIGRDAIEAWGVVSAYGLPDGREVVNTASRGFPWKASIGAEAVRSEFLDGDETRTVNGLEVDGPAFIVRESLLKEISVVPIAADEGTYVMFNGGPAQASRAPARPVPKPKSAGRIVGLAATFGRWMEPSMPDFPFGTRVRFSRGAFDGFLARVRRGKASVPLWFDHLDGTTTATTADGSLRVWTADDGLRFSVNGDTAKGRAALNLARHFTDTRSVSIGASVLEYTESERDFKKHLVVTEADLREISLVEEGACPGVWVRVY